MQYKTYQEAKVANPDREIYYSAARRLGDKGFYSIRGNATGFCHKCYPKDYCMTMERFFDFGNELVDGDIYLDTKGVAWVVGEDISTLRVNVAHHADKDCHILRAKALEDKIKEEIKIGMTCSDDGVVEGVASGTSNSPKKEVAHEWDGCGLPPSGIECECFCFDESKWLKVKVLDAITGSKEVAVAVICHGNRYRKVFWGVKFRPIETQQQREERKRLESAYHLACIAGAVDKWGGEFTFDEFKQDWETAKLWLAVVDETKYTKGK